MTRVVAFERPGDLRLAGPVVLVELEQRGHARRRCLAETVGVLAHDEVTLLEPHDALRLEPERGHAEVGSLLEAVPPTR